MTLNVPFQTFLIIQFRSFKVCLHVLQIHVWNFSTLQNGNFLAAGCSYPLHLSSRQPPVYFVPVSLTFLTLYNKWDDMVLCVFLFVSGGFYLAQRPLCCHSVGIPPFSPDRYSRPLRLWALLVLPSSSGGLDVWATSISFPLHLRLWRRWGYRYLPEALLW